ncbi:mitogenic factor, Streptodornase B [Streptococcus pseudoporcinus]|uniref:Mitogenic factor, Streptodornase B n=1 Tax=Streptococcus pseudoporcinus TaxID=361101 RepID=A0A4U9YDK2_9STRE|nr:mitogenic factor, Streptodornase B [Streptococcus pseudoporcinus]
MNLLGLQRVFSKKCRLAKLSLVALLSATFALTTLTPADSVAARETHVSNEVVLISKPDRHF